jgi:hypothetical protein
VFADLDEILAQHRASSCDTARQGEAADYPLEVLKCPERRARRDGVPIRSGPEARGGFIEIPSHAAIALGGAGALTPAWQRSPRG